MVEKLSRRRDFIQASSKSHDAKHAAATRVKRFVPTAVLGKRFRSASEPRQLTRFPDAIFVHAWSRDGKQLAVLTAKYTSAVVLITDLK
jgi:hypothetical protein